MNRLRPRQPRASFPPEEVAMTDDQVGGRRFTPNQVVAHNLRRARELRGWTQKRAAEQLVRFGVKWSLSSFSVAEGSVESGS